MRHLEERRSSVRRGVVLKNPETSTRPAAQSECSGPETYGMKSAGKSEKEKPQGKVNLTLDRTLRPSLKGVHFAELSSIKGDGTEKVKKEEPKKNIRENLGGREGGELQRILIYDPRARHSPLLVKMQQGVNAAGERKIEVGTATIIFGQRGRDL